MSVPLLPTGNAVVASRRRLRTTDGDGRSRSVRSRRREGPRTERGGQAQRLAVSGGRVRRGPMSARPGRLSAGPGAGRLRVLPVRRVRPGRGGRVQRGGQAVRRALGMRQDGKNNNNLHAYTPIHM